MGTELSRRDASVIVEQVIIKGNLAELTPAERVTYYNAVCDSLGLNPLTKPFAYLDLDGKLTLYALRDCTDQLRATRKINVTIVSREKVDDVYIVTARATTPDGRTDESIGAVALAKEDGDWQTSQNGKRYFKGNGQWKPLRGDALANALMKAETKSKRRATLSIVGLGWLDETEIETIPNARIVPVETATPKPALTRAPQAPISAESAAAYANTTTVTEVDATDVIECDGLRKEIEAALNRIGNPLLSFIKWFGQKYALDYATTTDLVALRAALTAVRETEAKKAATT